jgi:hypothetical protein
MNEDGKFPDYAEIWVGASRARDVYMALFFALATAAFTQSWTARQRNASEKRDLQPLGKPAGEVGNNKANAF